MRLTSRSEYALLALIYLARQSAEDYISAETIAEAQTIPLKFLEQILVTLKRAKYLRSMKGQHGGYSLARPADKITIAEVIRLLDGPLAPTESVSKYFYRPTPIEKEDKLIQLFTAIRECMLQQLESTTLADVS